MKTWMRALCAAAALAIAAGSGSTSAQAPGAPLPTGDAVLAKYVEATGGLAAYDAIKNRVVHARMEILGAGVVLGLTVYNAPPANLYTIVESEATGRIETGVSDGVAWENSAMRGAIVKDGIELDDARRDAIFDRIAHWREHLKSAECVGITDVNGKARLPRRCDAEIGDAADALLRQGLRAARPHRDDGELGGRRRAGRRRAGRLPQGGRHHAGVHEPHEGDGTGAGRDD